jgi:hypothetical protein
LAISGLSCLYRNDADLLANGEQAFLTKFVPELFS